MIRVSAIPYLNSVPFVYGLKQVSIAPHMELSFGSPAETAYRLHHDLCDLAIVPVAAVPTLPWYQIIGTHCIGAVSAVASVLLCSQVPVSQIEKVALDQDSRTSVLLARLLLRDHWRVAPRFIPLPADFPDHPPASAVLIGDKALLHRDKYAYIYDLAQHWIDWSGKPFVFALWVANKELPDGFADLFDQALAYGVAHID